MAEENQQAKQWAKVVAKAWADKDFKQRLIEDPATVLSEEGVDVPKGIDLRVLEATDKKAWLVLPPKPEEGEFTAWEERLAASCTIPM